MSRDPLEELFGPLDSDDTDTGAIETDDTAALGDADTSAATRAIDAERPFSRAARRDSRAAQTAAIDSAPTAAFGQLDSTELAPAPARPAAPVRAPRSVREEPPTQPVPAERKRSASALPWIIVAAVAVVALIGALLVVNSLRGDDAVPEATTEAPPTTPVTPEEEATTAPEPTPEEPAEPETPTVEVGPTFSMDISYANISVEASQKLTKAEWYYPGTDPERVMFASGLMGSFPESCADMRGTVPQSSPWGIEKGEGDTWTVVRPEGTCAAEPELYNEVWGLMQAVADSAKPL